MHRVARLPVKLGMAAVVVIAWQPSAAYGADLAAPVPLVSAFLDTLGVAIHAGYTDGAYAKTAQIIADLDYLGIHQLRDGTPDPNGGIPYRNYRDAIEALVRAGNRFVFNVGSGQPIAVSLGQIDEIEKARPGAVTAVEGPNEINNGPVSYHGLTGEAGAEAFQRALYAAVKADAALAHLPVYDFTGGDAIDLASIRDLADAANAHPYPNRGEPPGVRIAGEFSALFGKFTPKVITETGYFDNPLNPFGSGVDSMTQAKLTLDLVFSTFAQGVAKTYLYQLRAAYPDPHGDSTDTEYGLFALDNAPKPAAIALHNLTSILAHDPAEPGHPNLPPPAYHLTGLPPEAHQLLLRRGSRDFVLVVWAEPAIWNEAIHRPVPAGSVPVTVSFAQPPRTVRLYDPLTGMAPLQSYRDVGSLELEISDHPLLVLLLL